MRRWLPVLLLSLLVTGLAGLARAESAAVAALDSTCKYDDGLYDLGALKVIYKPLVNIPAIVRPGDTLTVWANAGTSVIDWAASLKFGALTVPLMRAGGGYSYSLGFWALKFKIPAGVAEEVYDLVLASSSTVTDTTHHSVKVIPAFRHDFYFAQISDTHLPDNGFSSDNGWSTCDTAQVADWNAVIDDFNYIHPEFVLHTGDLINEGDLQRLYHMYEYARAQRLMYRLRDPIFVVSGNHDIGGWSATPAPAGTARVDWWRFFGWPFLANPPAGYPYHSQLYSFDYDSLHVIGMEAYNNYDRYLPSIYGTDSFTQEEMNWLTQDIAAAGTKHKLLFYHYDFNQGVSGGHQINVGPLGLDGAIYGHLHSSSEGSRTIPFNLELNTAGSGKRAFRIFRVHNGVMTPTIMHRSGSAVDSLSAAWTGANDGTRTRLTCAVTNRFGETWEHSRLVFHMVDHDSDYAATGGTLAQTIREGGRVHVYVDCALTGGGGVTSVSVYPTTPLVVGVDGSRFATLRLERPAPAPYRAGSGPLTLHYSLPAAGPVRVEILDLAGRRVAMLADVRQVAGEHRVSWNARGGSGDPAASGLYFVRVQAGGEHRTERIVLIR